MRILIFFLLLPAPFLSAGIRSTEAPRTWTLTSGNTQYILRQHDGGVLMDYFGPAGGAPWKTPRPESFGTVEGQSMRPEALEFASARVEQRPGGLDALHLLYHHRGLEMDIEVRYTTYGDTGVIGRSVTLTNNGDPPLHAESLGSLSWTLPPGEYELTYLHGGWGRERQAVTERLGAGRRSFDSRKGRSTNGYSPWFCLRNESLGVRYIAQLAYSGNWSMSFERYPGSAPLAEQELHAALGMRPDFGGALAIESDDSFTLPEAVFAASSGDLDDAANLLHRYQRQFVFPRTAANDPPLVQFNSWYPFPGKMTVEEMKRCADVAAELGAEVFVLDAGWFNKKDWSRELGDWQVDRAAYPRGLEELAQHVRSRGMKFGVWVEIENLGVESQTFKDHPEWCLRYNGKPILVDARYHLNFARPDVRQWARAVIDRLVRDYGIEWVKIDYNIDAGDAFDPSGAGRPGDVLHRHLAHYYKWLDEVRGAYPKLIIENCSSGGLRFDIGILAHTHINWLSDVVEPLPSLQLGWGCTLEFAPQVCNHWMVGDKANGEVNLSAGPGWWDFLLRVPMNGQFGISSRVFDWSPELKRRAADNVALYRRIRKTIAAGDVYHLTPQPDHDRPSGWMAIQYVPPSAEKSVLLVYRLAGGGPRETYHLRGLKPDSRYRVTQDGASRGAFAGRQLAAGGLAVELGAEWRAAVIELEESR